MATLDKFNLYLEQEQMIVSFEKMLEDDIKTNKAIGDVGAKEILNACQKDRVKILTHCNTG